MLENSHEVIRLRARVVTSIRIQARAIRRCGELLKQIEPSKGGDASLFVARDGADPSVTRKLAAEQAGLSERQRKTALRARVVTSI